MTNGPILVTGASGNVGSAAVHLLAQQGLPARALVRDPGRLPRGGWDGVELVVGDFTRPETLDTALRGVRTMLLISPAVPAYETAAIDAAARRGDVAVVKITNHKASADSPVGRRRDHAAVEAHLAASGLDHVLLAPNLFMQNLFAMAPEIAASSGFSMSAGAGRFGMIDARDVAAAAVAVAADPTAHAGRRYLLTGPALVSFDDVARALTTVLGRSIEYRRLTPDDHRDAMIASGVPESVATSNAQVFGSIAEGDAAWCTDDAAMLIGRPPRSLSTFVAEHAERFA
jgi:uncharacterized protein YbjT (DUF2867 family)